MKRLPGKIKDKYKILGVIGEGAYGIVLKARRRDSDTLVAIKHFKQTPGYCSDVNIIDRELKILQSLRFPNVVELLEWFRDKKHCFLIFEYVEWNMLQVLQKHPEGLPIEHVRYLSYQLFTAIHWCHTQDIIHRDIKPENLLISKNFVLKLCDFGFARFCNTQTTADYYTDYVATRWYRSPELIIGSPYGKPVDIWACGCIMAELSTGRALFAGESDIDQLYRIQKYLGPLPNKYLEAIRSNPKFEGLKFPSTPHRETLERRFAHLFPPNMMHLFKNTLRLYAIDRLTAEKCMQHETFLQFHPKRTPRVPPRPKSVYTSNSTSQFEQNNESIQHETPFTDHRLSKSYDEHTNAQFRYRSSDNFTVPSLAPSPIKYRSTTQLNDRSPPIHRHQPKIMRTHSRTYSSSSNEQIPVPMFTPRSSNDASDDDDEQNNVVLRRKHHQSQQLPASPTTKYASNGVLLRPKPPLTPAQHPMNVLPTTSDDMGKRFKRFSLDQQQTLESNPYRSSIAVVPTHQSNSMGLKPVRDEMIHDIQQQQRAKTREINREMMRQRASEYCVPLETVPTPVLQRASSRQTSIIMPDYMDQGDVDSSVSTTNRHAELPSNQRYSWNPEQLKPIYGSDSYLLNSNRNTPSAFHRPFYSPPKTDYNKPVLVPQREFTHEPIKSTKTPSKQNPIAYPKTPSESNRKSQSNGHAFNVYPFARTAILHLTNALIPSSHQRQQSARFVHSKVRQNDG